MPGKKFGRRIRIAVGGLTVCDLNPREPEGVNVRRNLNVTFSTQSHTKVEPLVTEVTIYGLNQATRKQLTVTNDQARAIAWQAYQQVQLGEVLVDPENAAQVQSVTSSLVSKGMSVTIEAGYDDDFGIIANAQILPTDGLSHERQAGGGWVTMIKAQDTRLPWANAFVSEEIVPGVPLVFMEEVLAGSEQVLSGEISLAQFQDKFGDFVERLDGVGYENGRILHGASRNEQAALYEALGLRGPILANGAPILLSGNTTSFGQAVVLQLPGEDIDGQVIAPGGLLSVKELPRGYQEITTLLNYRLVAGRQVQLLDEFAFPIGIGGGFYRVDVATHTGTSYETPYHTHCVLRPVTLPPENNP